MSNAFVLEQELLSAVDRRVERIVGHLLAAGPVTPFEAQQAHSLLVGSLHPVPCVADEGNLPSHISMSSCAAGDTSLEQGLPASSAAPDFNSLAKGWDVPPEQQEVSYWLSHVEGTIPPEINGTFIRNGPGHLKRFGRSLVHPIDGDGLVAALTLTNGRAHIKAKYVKTKEFVEETQANKVLYYGMMGSSPGTLKHVRNLLPMLWGHAPHVRIKNPSNTNVLHWGTTLLSMWERGLPYRLDPFTLETIGVETLDGVLKESGCFSAHYRFDDAQKRMVSCALKLRMGKPCTLFFYEFNEDFKLVAEKKAILDNFHYCHDFILTKNYYVVYQTPMYSLDPAYLRKWLLGQLTTDKLMSFDAKRPSRMIVIPRDPQNTNIRFFDTEPTHIYHFVNGYEETGAETDAIVFTACAFEKAFTMEFDKKTFLSNLTKARALLTEYRIDLLNNTCTRRTVDRCACEFPSHNPHYDTRYSRYAYLMACDQPEGTRNAPFEDIVKADVEGQQRSVWNAGYGNAVCEPMFIPKDGATQEDEGWVICQVYNGSSHETQFVLLDAQNIEGGPIARLHLEHPLPYAFHGQWVPQVFMPSQ
eukprot:GILK01009302.1.p1 GENE.GILK01009302.1~~GILK01009302.1.p1  ORF type:complete len:586 (-),score=77.87 GILK01009302.1:70-1827(-)